MAQGCLKCLKYTMCFANLLIFYVFLCQICGVAVLGFGVYMMVNFKLAALTPTLASFNFANMLLVCGIVITCVSFLGFLGALKENRCLLLTFFLLLFILMLVELTVACLLLMYEGEIGRLVKEDLTKGLEKARGSNSTSEWDLVQETGCLLMLKNLFEENFLTTGISVIVLCIIEVLGMCFAMTLFCHISRSGLGYKL
ncbi:hypothetical protein FQN60_018287 [Etheostoma spectabile]|uniref:Tetraspanin n=1 Tax=Etheostoma spectabile TaxID=54343 RepID=A0A5J5DHM1_9PERO|nr:hypothetical protein FQN60_018287 [Etheostoma spectabile]